MANFYDTCLRRMDIQTEPILPEGYGALEALQTLFEVLAEAYELQRELARRYPTVRL